MTTLERLGPAAFQGLAGEWGELVASASARHPFLLHGWLTNWLAAFGGDDHEVLVARRAGRIVAGWSARRDQDGALSALEDHTYWPHLVHRDRDGLRAFLEALAAAGVRRAVLRGPADEPYHAALSAAARGRYLVEPEPPSPLHRIALAGDLEAYLRGREGKVRSELRRKLRRFDARHPGWSLEVLGRDRASEAIAAIEPVERASWKAGAGTAITSTAAELAFYRGVLALADPEVEPACFVAATAGTPCAFLLGLRHGATFFALKTSYREDAAADSPGLVLLCHALSVLGRHGRVESIELLGRDSRWKREVATSAGAERRYVLTAPSLTARAVAWARRHARPLRARLVHARRTP